MGMLIKGELPHVTLIFLLRLRLTFRSEKLRRRLDFGFDLRSMPWPC